MKKGRLPKSHSNPIPEVKKEVRKRSNSDSISLIPSNLQRCLVKELKEYCGMLNLDVNGKKQDLIDKIINERMRLINNGMDGDQELETGSKIPEEHVADLKSRSRRTRGAAIKQVKDDGVDKDERVISTSGQDPGLDGPGQRNNLAKPKSLAQKITKRKRGKGAKKTVRDSADSIGVQQIAVVESATETVSRRKGRETTAIYPETNTADSIPVDENISQPIPRVEKENEILEKRSNLIFSENSVDISKLLSTEMDFKSISDQGKMSELEDPDDSFGIGIQSTFSYKSIYPSLNESAAVNQPAPTLKSIGSAIHQNIIQSGKTRLDCLTQPGHSPTNSTNPSDPVLCKIQQLRDALKKTTDNTILDSFYCVLCDKEIRAGKLGGKAIIQYLSVYLQGPTGKTSKLLLNPIVPEEKKDETSVCTSCFVKNDSMVDQKQETSEISIALEDYLPQKESIADDTTILLKPLPQNDNHDGLNLEYAVDDESNFATNPGAPTRPSKKRPYKAYSPTKVNAAIRNSPVAHTLPPTKKFKSAIPVSPSPMKKVVYPVVSPSPAKKFVPFKKPTKFSSILQSPLRQNIPKYLPKENEKVKERLDNLLATVVPGSKEEWDLIHSASPRIPRE
ncbi:hypothetical protein HDV01_005445 [Terramyces sp. JEL0728]|nr:hypothetical protein HDV01_005445 [Terramyces sp. JEL0728]